MLTVEGGRNEKRRSALGRDQPLQACAVANEQRGAAQLSEFFLAELAKHPGNGFARGSDELRDLFVGKRNLDANAVLGLVTIAGPFQ